MYTCMHACMHACIPHQTQGALSSNGNPLSGMLNLGSWDARMWPGEWPTPTARGCRAPGRRWRSPPQLGQRSFTTTAKRSEDGTLKVLCWPAVIIGSSVKRWSCFNFLVSTISLSAGRRSKRGCQLKTAAVASSCVEFRKAKY